MYGGSPSRTDDTEPVGYHMHYHATSALPFPLLPLPQLAIPDEHQINQVSEFDMMDKSMKPQAYYGGSSSSSSCYDSPNSALSYGEGEGMLQRSISSHALLHRINEQHSDYSSCPYPPATSEFVDPEADFVRRVYSAGDLQRRMNGGTAAIMENAFKRSSESPPLPLRSESSLIIEGMSRACRYSPEEKKERIERYRNKRNQRNFNKKIKYACRKTLADSRPRIRGRFARNDETDQKCDSHQLDDQWNLQMGGEEDEEEDDNWISFIDAFSSGNLIIP